MGVCTFIYIFNLHLKIYLHLKNPNKQLFQTINGLLETAPSTMTWCVVPFKNRKS